MTVSIQLEWTPNPNTLKYVVDAALLPRGAMNFTTPESAIDKSPLVSKLFEIPGVSAIMLGSNFVTVTKGEDGEWDTLNDGVMIALERELDAGTPAATPEALAAQTQAVRTSGTDVEARIRAILDDEIRPAVAMDGGDITFDRYEDGTVYVHMQGSCSGCPSSTATLRMGIETRLREVVPELVEVVPI